MFLTVEPLKPSCILCSYKKKVLRYQKTWWRKIATFIDQ